MKNRFPLLVGGVISLITGLWGGLVLLGLDVPLPRSSFAAQHGVLMSLGFLGTLISLERAVALGRRWGYAAPALAGTGGIVCALGADLPGRLLLTLAGGWLVAVYVMLVARRGGRDVWIQAAGAVAWYGGGMLWLTGRPITDVVPWLAGFLVLTIIGERLELARIAFSRRAVADGVTAAAMVLAAGVVLSAFDGELGWRVAGAGMLALAGWLALHDVARRTVRGRGLPRFAAACMLLGYAWLAVAGALWTLHGRPAGAAYDAGLHALFLGFVMSMVFGHAPVILPAVLRIRLPYHPVLYAPLALLHGSLLLRVSGDWVGIGSLRTAGGVLGEVSLVALAGCVVILTSRAARTARTARADQPKGRTPSKPA